MLRFLSFVSVGVIATFVQYLVLIASVQGLHADAVVASTVGFVVAATVNYILNRRYTFGSAKPHLETAPKFFLVAAVGLWLNGVLLAAGMAIAGLHYIAAQVIATGCVLLWNYTINAVWTFAVKAHGRPL